MVINELQVLMNNVPVGRLSKNQLGLMSFVYDAFWLEHPARVMEREELTQLVR